MDLKNKTLEGWLVKPPKGAFYNSKPIDYISRYNSLKKYLKDNVHDIVSLGETLKDPDIILNDHGPKHIETVISRASELVDGSKCILTPYEVYLLLSCIQLHDTGNFLGRHEHELNIALIMKEARNLCGKNDLEERSIFHIASSHGGRLQNGDKDKVSRLQDYDLAPDGGKFRPRLIASILRFADELADDTNRADHIRLKNGTLRYSEVFHAYAACLSCPEINHKEKNLNLKYSVPIKYLTRKFKKKVDDKKTEEYIIDEIYSRLTKMYKELLYCTRFTRDSIELCKISVTIEFIPSSLRETPLPSIKFVIQETGYPGNNLDIYAFTDGMLFDATNKMNGEYFHAKYST